MQRYLVTRVAEEMELVGVVFQVETEHARKRLSRFRLLLHPVSLLKHLLGRWVIRRETAHCADIYEPIQRIVKQVSLPRHTLTVTNINDPRTIELLQKVQPDVVLVNGTKLIRSPLLDLAPMLRLGMINLHTGLSPYSRGGNCNLNMIREGRPELIGVTIHHIDAGVDSGDLILTARPDLEDTDCFERIETKVFLLGIDLMMVAVRQSHEGSAVRVPQWTEGKVFLKRTGYEYQPWHRFEAHRKLRNGLIPDYLANRVTRDADVRLAGQTDS